MTRFMMMICLMLGPMAANAYLIVQDIDLTDKQKFGDFYIEGNTDAVYPKFFYNNWFVNGAETAGYVAFEAYTNFDTVRRC